jgi:hypothetical protein
MMKETNNNNTHTHHIIIIDHREPRFCSSGVCVTYKKL